MRDSSTPRKQPSTIGTVILLVFVAAVGTGVWSQQDATRRAEAFCRSIARGEVLAPLEERARASGAERVYRGRVDGKDELIAIYAGAPLGIRSLCAAEIVDDRVVRTRSQPLD